ncbi:outer membrane autotransporter barrel domain-containing protein [Pragia fontium]|uniref:Outer membrane autotransporter barrel domain-containing protein n=1 Tax=Pragia fontium TaxID=82985 RepID=A0ABQ5LCZ7_9GAMM|nr:autotransporter outer membrane beta-barrel domain-containing protein [Pragia fontium]GKX61490.1 outer membrane autotransporter barrel domain-containing protein [Pragia fontium]
MDAYIYPRDFRKKSIDKFSKCILNQSVTMMGLLSLSIFTFQHQALADDLGSQNANTIELNDGDKIIGDLSWNGVRYGVLNMQNQTANIHLANDVSISVVEPDSVAEGIIISGKNSILTANRLSVEVTGRNVMGLNINGSNAKINLGSGSKIVVAASGTDRASGISVSGGTTLQADHLLVSTQGDYGAGLRLDDNGTSVDLGEGSAIYTTGRSNNGVYISGSEDSKFFKASGLTIETKGNTAYGIETHKSSSVDLGNGSKISTSGEDANGLLIWGLGDIKATALTVKTAGAGATAIEIRDNSVANIGANSHLSVNESGALLAYNTGSGKATINFLGTSEQRNTIFSNGSYGVSAQYNSDVNLSNTDININLGVGLWALGRGKITGDNLTIKGAVGNAGVYAMTDSQIDLTGNTIIHMATSNDVAFSTQHNNGYAASRINATGKMTIQGGIRARGGIIHVDMDSGSYWSGHAYSDNINGGELNISMADSRWNMTADSNLDKLVLNNSMVDFSEDKVGSLLTIGELSGNGHFILRTDLVSDGVNAIGDKLVVSGKSEGNHQLTVLNRGSLATTGNEILTVVETQDGQATFTSTSEVELGGYLYAVRQNGTHWELYSPGVYVPPPEPEPEPQPDPEPIPEPEPNPNPSITTSADAGANFLNIGYLLNYAESQTLFQRMGDLRQTGKSGDMWLRGFAGKFDSFAGGKLSRFDMNYDGMQLGADKQVTEQLPVFMGIFTGLTKGSPNYASGDGTVKSHHFGVYGTYIAENGFYLDGMVKYSRLKNDFSVRDSQNNRVSGNGSSDGVSFSLETGQKLSLGQQGNGFYIEPQAQLSYSHQDATRVNASNGLKVDLGSYESLIGRTSAVVGYELQQGGNSLNVYLKTGYLREFAGDTDYRLNGSPESHSFKGGWWNNGVGVSAQMNQQHTLYLDLDTSTGNKFNQRQINAGYRFSF